ncbi:MAG: DUF418 domain-containing protein [Bacteroidota bacterium]
MNSKITATGASERIGSLDFLRGVAVLGILFINIENFAYFDSWSPWRFGFTDPVDQHTRFWVYFLTQGKFYNMFALLFGVGFYIFLERLEEKKLGIRAMDIYARRLLWLFIIGVGHAYLIWNGDVLYHYSVCGFFLFPFRSFTNQSLLGIVIFLAFIQLSDSYGVIKRRQQSYESFAQAKDLPEDQRTDEQLAIVEYWKNRLVKKTADTLKVDPPKETYLLGLKESHKEMQVHKGMLYHKGLIFPSLMVMIIGILLYKQGLFTNCKKWKYYWPITLSILLVGFIINYLRFHRWTYDYNDPILSMWEGLIFTFPKQLLGLGYILLLNGLFQKFLLNSRLQIISNIGRMALSNYLFQNILLGLIFYGYGLAKFNQYSRLELLAFVLVIWAFQLVFSWFWLKRFSQGPMEWFWRKMTYRFFKF